VDRDVAQVVAVDQDATAGGVVEARQQLHDRRLAGPGVPDQCHRLAGLDLKRDAV
jgi:hypothetical protein